MDVFDLMKFVCDKGYLYGIQYFLDHNGYFTLRQLCESAPLRILPATVFKIEVEWNVFGK